MTGIRTRACLICGLCLAALLLTACAALAAGEMDHSVYDALLKKYSRGGLVDYGALKEDMSGLGAYIRTLSDSSAAGYKTWSRDEKMAFWINAYNAVTIYAVVRNYPIRPEADDSRQKIPANSVRRIKGFWDTAYVELAGRPVSLDEIEREILLQEFGDPRVLFALVKASAGSPLLSEDAYVAKILDEQLERDAVRFVNDYDKVRVNITRGRLHVSEIFDLHKGDFTVESGEIPEWLGAYKKKTRGFVGFIAERVDARTRQAMQERALRVDYLSYDWSLNELVED